MKLLAIETSCDETGVAIIEFKKESDNFKVLANLLISQIDIHKEFGGVYPNLAKREHTKNLPILIDKSLEKAKLDIKDLDAIAVTMGPGLAPALWVGVEEAKRLAKENNIPLYGINHMEGHIYASIVEEKKKNEYTVTKPKVPALALLISGGHTEIVFMPTLGKYQKVGETLDDAAGEAFDKAARSLGLEYPGGPKISKLADNARKRGAVTPENIRLPRPMINSKTLDFSFSGLKTAVMYAAQKNEINNELREVFCMEFENAVTDVIVKKVETAGFLYNAKTLIVGGGVSANTHIREAVENVCKRDGMDLYLPKKDMSTDNALMIAIIAMVKIQNNTEPDSNLNLSAQSNLSLGAK